MPGCLCACLGSSSACPTYTVCSRWEGSPHQHCASGGGRQSPSLTPELRYDLARRGYRGKPLFRTRGCPGCVALPLKCLPGKFGASPETAGDWASGHLVLQPDAEVVPTASEAGVDLPVKLEGRKEEVFCSCQCCVMRTPNHTTRWQQSSPFTS